MSYRRIPAKNLYTALGFKKFENIIYLAGDIAFLSKSKNTEEINVRFFQKSDLDEVYNLIKASEDPNRLDVFGFRKGDLKNSFLQHLMGFSKQKKIVAIYDDRIVGYVQTSCTTQKEAGHIDNLHVQPENRSGEIEKTLVFAAVEEIKQCGTIKVVSTVSTLKQELIETMTNQGFKKYMEMEGMFLET